MFHVIPRPVRRLVVGIRSPLQCPVIEHRKGMRIATAPAGLRNDGGSIWGVPKAAGKLKVERGKWKVENSVNAISVRVGRGLAPAAL